MKIHRPWLWSLLVALPLMSLHRAASSPSPAAPRDASPFRVASKDGTPIAVECEGSGPRLVIVHGGVGDRTRWKPMFPLLSRRFTVCAMDRRGHGTSADSADYALGREAEDVAAVVDSRPGTVFVLGHSYGGVAALEATFLTNRISKLLLYEPPLQDRIDLSVVERIEALLQGGERGEAVATFLREIVGLSPDEVEAMRSRPSWSTFVAGIGAQPRELRALASYRFDADRMATVHMPTLLITGADTASPRLKEAITSLRAALPNVTLVVLEGQQHNAMDTGRQRLAEAVTHFLLDAGSGPARYGLEGANGAGKTTLIKHVLGLLRAESGTVRVFGLDPVEEPVAVLSRIGYLSEENDLPGWMRVDELLLYSRAFYPAWDDAYAEELRQAFALEPAARSCAPSPMKAARCSSRQPARRSQGGPFAAAASWASAGGRSRGLGPDRCGQSGGAARPLGVPRRRRRARAAAETGGCAAGDRSIRDRPTQSSVAAALPVP